MPDTKQTTKQFDNFLWIDFCKPGSQSLDEIAEEYALDYFQVKDSLEDGHLPKFEKQPRYNFLILRAFTSSIEQAATSVAELSNKIAFFYNTEKIITVHRFPFPFLDDIRSTFKTPDEFLIYVINKMVETYQPPLDVLDEKITEFEKTIFLQDYSKVPLKELYFLKTQTRITKKLLQIFQHVVHELEVSDNSSTAFQDIKDSLLNLILNYDEVLENAQNLLSTYLSVNAQKNNDVMKLLTVFSAFFLPLTFIAGIYGMNFDYMPELRWHLGYFNTLGLMAVVALIIYVWFKKKKIF